MIELLVNLLSPHLGVLARLSIFEVLQTRERASTPYLSVVFTLDSRLSLSRSWDRIIHGVYGCRGHGS